MKTGTKILSVIAMAILLAWPAKSSEIKKQIGEARYQKAVANLLAAIKSANIGLRTSATYLLGEFQAEEAVIPLMRLLHNVKKERSRIAAAWALCRIGDARGVFAVKQAVRFDESKKVQRLCAWYYNVYVDANEFAFVPSVTPVEELSSK
jgi:HEAT repeat protein